MRGRWSFHTRIPKIRLPVTKNQWNSRYREYLWPKSVGDSMMPIRCRTKSQCQVMERKSPIGWPVPAKTPARIRFVIENRAGKQCPGRFLNKAPMGASLVTAAASTRGGSIHRVLSCLCPSILSRALMHWTNHPSQCRPAIPCCCLGPATPAQTRSAATRGDPPCFRGRAPRASDRRAAGRRAAPNARGRD
jgi:hypothetical protein